MTARSHTRRVGFGDILDYATRDRGLEWLSATIMLMWGFVLMAPGDTLAGPQYVAFLRFGATEEFWAFSFTAVGATRLAALYINGRWPRTPLIRMGGSLFGAISWGQVTWLLFESSVLQGQPWNTGVAAYGPMALAELLSIYRAAIDARYYRS